LHIAHLSASVLLLPTPHPPTSTLFPYTTLFRSAARPVPLGRLLDRGLHGAGDGATVGGAGARGRPVGAVRHGGPGLPEAAAGSPDRKSTRLNSSHRTTSYAVFCLKKKNKEDQTH